MSPPLTDRVPTTTLGRTGLQVSRMALGLWGFGDASAPQARIGSDEQAIATLRTAFEAGVTLLDSAEAYDCEARLGRLLRAVDAPAELTIVTKFGHGKGFSADQFRASAERSLRELGLKRIELMMIHDPRNEDDMRTILGRGGALEGLRRLQDEGLVTNIGVATGTIAPLHDAVACGEFDVIQFPRLYTMLNRAAVSSGLLAAARDRGIGTLLAAPFGGNVLATGVRGTTQPLYGYWDAIPEVVEAVASIESRASEFGVPLATAALAYAVTAAEVDSVVVGTTAPEQVLRNLGAFSCGLNRTQLEQIANAGRIDEALVGGPDFLWPFPDDRMPASLRAALDAASEA